MINALAQEIHYNAVNKGFYREQEVSPGAIAIRLALIHSEVSEALECVRLSDMPMRYDGFKPEGFASELADVIIRTLDLAAWLGLDIEDAIACKMAYNKTRSMMHGKSL